MYVFLWTFNIADLIVVVVENVLRAGYERHYGMVSAVV